MTGGQLTINHKGQRYQVVYSPGEEAALEEIQAKINRITNGASEFLNIILPGQGQFSFGPEALKDSVVSVVFNQGFPQEKAPAPTGEAPVGQEKKSNAMPEHVKAEMIAAAGGKGKSKKTEKSKQAPLKVAKA